ncbi:hypothetical protein [Streptomyces sp. NPDC059994]|uniref:hypothetical protein n=1 Tax=Streptomyces sp. NPDC059994 TaxID=3347029 RepID=UPI00368E1E66
MARFLIGLLLGAAAAGITWAASHHGSWALIAAIVVAVLVWFGEFILDDLL